MTFRILIVEDDLVQSSMLSGLLASHRYYVDTAANGLEGLRKVQNGCFDLVHAGHVRSLRDAARTPENDRALRHPRSHRRP